MANEALFLELAKALARPSGAYRAANEAINIPAQGLEGYVGGLDIADKIQQRKDAQKTLTDLLGGNVPERIKPYSNLTARTTRELGGLKGLADITDERPVRSVSIDELLADNVRNGRMTWDQVGKIKRSMSPAAYQPPKPPSGYRYDSDGNLIAIPGGPAAAKTALEAEKRSGSRRDELEKANRIIGNIDDALSGVGPTTVGVAGSVLRHIPATAAKNLDETLKTVRANVGFETLQSMRQNSPTGGALGQVSDRENSLLQAVRGSLDQAQSVDQISKNLRSLRQHYGNVALAMESETGDQEADDAIAKVISANIPEGEKRARISGIRSAAARQ